MASWVSTGSTVRILDKREYPIDYRESDEAAFPLEAHATNVVTEGIQLRREKQCADLAQNAANYATGNKIVLSGNDQFTDGTNSDPEGVISDAKSSVRKKIAKDPNTMVIPQVSWDVMKRHPKLRELLATTSKRLVRKEDLQDIFEIENIVIAASYYASDDTDEFVELWQDNIVLAYVPPAQANMANQLDLAVFGALIHLQRTFLTDGVAVGRVVHGALDVRLSGWYIGQHDVDHQ